MTTHIPNELQDELRVAGLTLSEQELERAVVVWQENLSRRDWLRAQAFRDDEVPFGEWPGPMAAQAAAPPAPGAGMPERVPSAATTAAPAQAADDGDPTSLDLATLSGLIASGALSAQELVRAYLDRLQRHDGALRTSITVMADQALEAAARADRRRAAGERRSDADGVPIGLKDCIDVAGVPTTAGSRVRARKVAESDADCVARLRDAGAIVLAKQSMHEFGAGPALPGGPLATGRNPWDLSRIPGGSSSGSAAAVAAGLCAAALGTDTAGSVRIPAAFTGLVGFKPTRKAIGMRGVLPFCWSMDHVGTLTRTVTDAAILLSVTANTPALRQLSDAAARTAQLEAGVRGLRLGVLRRYYLDPPDLHDDVRRAAEEALQVWERAGATLVTVDMPSIDRNDVVYTTLLAESYAYHQATLRAHSALYSDWFRVQLHVAASFSAGDVLRARRLQARLCEDSLRALSGVDALVHPGMAVPASPFGASFIGALTQPRSRFTRPWNVTGLPAMALPCGFSQDGLPLSMHVVARPHDEPMVLRVGRAYERETSWHRRRPDPAGWVVHAAAGARVPAASSSQLGF